MVKVENAVEASVQSSQMWEIGVEDLAIDHFGLVAYSDGNTKTSAVG